LSTAGTIYAALQNQGGVAPCVLRYVSTTQLRLDPVGSTKIKINGTWRTIPAAGITTSNVAFINGTASQNLATSTNYFVYAFWDGSAIKIDFSTTGHSTSTTAGNVGTEIKTGDDTRSLIGYIRTSADSPPAQFRQNAKQRMVRSWFNRQLDESTLEAQLGSQVSTSSGTPAVSSGTFGFDFVMWAGETFTAHFIGCGVTTGGGNSYTAFWWDGALSTNPNNNYAFFGTPAELKPNSITESMSYATDGSHTLYQVMWTAATSFAVGRSAAPYVVLSGRIQQN